jgi:hypothetical protein
MGKHWAVRAHPATAGCGQDLRKNRNLKDHFPSAAHLDLIWIKK